MYDIVYLFILHCCIIVVEVVAIVVTIAPVPVLVQHYYSSIRLLWLLHTCGRGCY